MTDIPMDGALAQRVYELAGCSGLLQIDLSTGTVYMCDLDGTVVFRCRVVPEHLPGSISYSYLCM